MLALLRVCPPARGPILRRANGCEQETDFVAVTCVLRRVHSWEIGGDGDQRVIMVQNTLTLVIDHETEHTTKTNSPYVKYLKLTGFFVFFSYTCA
jgi:hypothetical protein